MQTTVMARQTDGMLTC